MNKMLLLTFVCLLLTSSCTSDDSKEIIKEETPGTQPQDPSSQNSRTYYVSLTGNDNNSADKAKNESTPWRTIQKAANTIAGGDTVVILDGTYHEQVTVGARCSGSQTAPTLFVAKNDGRVIIDDEHDGVSERFTSVFKIDRAKYIKIEGLKVINSRWYGFSVENYCDNITINKCSTYNTRASGIYVAYASNMTITNNNVEKACQEHERDSKGNGSQECITLARTNQFEISHNEVHGSTVDGAAGGEGIDTKGGSYDGEISHNYIHDIVPLAIYVDAGSGESRNIRVFSNKAVNTGGFAVAGELGGHADNIYYYNNVIVNSALSGFVFQNVQNGKFTNIYVVNNTFYNTNTTGGFGGEIANYSKNEENENLVIKNNLFFNEANKQRFSIWHDVAAPHDISHNLYCNFKPGNSGGVNSFTESNLTDNDIRNQDPLFVNGSAYNFNLQVSSPAINRAVPITLPGSEELLFDTDYNGKKRDTSNWDMGAFEYSAEN